MAGINEYPLEYRRVIYKRIEAATGESAEKIKKAYFKKLEKILERGVIKDREEKSIQGSIALQIANLCRILIFRNVLWISDAEHGISMLDKYQNVGWKKFYLIYGMCDETFSVNCTTEVPEGVDKGWFMFFVTLLNQIYWVGGATAGALLGTMVTRFLPFLIFPEGKEPPDNYPVRLHM